MDDLQQQAIATGLKERTLRNKKRLQAALNRIRFGTFGLCCSCGDPITRQYITADPAAPFCADCQDEIEFLEGKSAILGLSVVLLKY